MKTKQKGKRAESGSSSVVRGPACKKTTGVSASRYARNFARTGGGFSRPVVLSRRSQLCFSRFHGRNPTLSRSLSFSLSTPLTSCTVCSYTPSWIPLGSASCIIGELVLRRTLCLKVPCASNFEGRPIRERRANLGKSDISSRWTKFSLGKDFHRK